MPDALVLAVPLGRRTKSTSAVPLADVLGVPARVSLFWTFGGPLALPVAVPPALILTRTLAAPDPDSDAVPVWATTS